MNVSQTSDVDLFERLRAGDAGALEPLMDRFAGRVYRVASGICGSSPDAEEVVQDVFLTLFRKAGSFEGRAATLGLALEASVEDGVRARIDGARIRQAVGNLIDNALRQTPAGGRVTVEMSARSGIISIAVADTGVGFETGYLPRAFEAFSRADESRSRAAGGK